MTAKRAMNLLETLFILEDRKRRGRKVAMKRTKTKVVAVVCGLVCAACVFGYLQSVKGEADAVRAEALARYGGEQLEVCVARRDIAAGETVGADAVEVRLWVADLLPAEAARSIDEVVGRQAASPVIAGEVVSLKRFERAGAELDVPEGLVAVSVAAKDVQAVGGAVVAGSHVDVYASGNTSTEAIARNVLVVGTSASTADGQSSSDISWVTMALEPESVQEVIAASQKTELYFALPAEGSAGTLSTSSTASVGALSVDDMPTIAVDGETGSVLQSRFGKEGA